jgi:hypothetical protein
VATLLQEPARPGRMGSRLYGYTQGPLGGEAPSEGLGSGTQPTLLDDLAALLVDEAEVGVFVAEIQSGCHQWMLFATIHGGPILLSGLLEPVELLQTQGYCAGGRPSHLIFSELREGGTSEDPFHALC